MTKNMNGINNKGNGVVLRHPLSLNRECVLICLVTFMQIVNNFALEPSAKFTWVSKSPIVPGIIDLPKFNYEDLEEIVAGGQGSLGVYR